MLLLRRTATDDDAAPGGAGRPRLFPAVPRLLVGLTGGKCAPPDCESPAAVRSPTSPLDLWAFPALAGGSHLLRSPRSPRSWDSHRVGLGGIVDDTLAADPAAGAKNRLLGPQMRPSFKLPQRLAKSCSTSQPKDCARPAPELGKVEVVTAGASGMPAPCSKSVGDLKSGPEPIMPDSASILSADLGKYPAPGSLPVGRYIRSVSATEVEQSEDYTCIIAHGPNPKTTHIFGDCILEPITVRVPDGGESVEVMEVKEAAAESYWLVKCSGEELSDSCLSCKENLDGNNSCILRGDTAFCSVNCKDQEILVEEEEEENIAAISSFSSFGSSSSLNDDIFMAGMVVLTGPFDTQLP